MADVLKVMALSCGLDQCVPPRAAFKTVTIAVSGTAVLFLRGDGERGKEEKINTRPEGKARNGASGGSNGKIYWYQCLV